MNCLYRILRRHPEPPPPRHLSDPDLIRAQRRIDKLELRLQAATANLKNQRRS